MKLRTRINRLTLLATLVLALLVSAVVSVVIRDYAEEQARKQGLVVVDMARIGLLHSMQEGMAFSDDKDHVRREISQLFGEFAAIPELIEMRALRAESVTRQYGAVASRGAIEDVERQMLETGKPSERIELNAHGTKVYHYNGPLIASSRGALNCMKCHDAREGEVLGGLSVQVDLTDAEAAVRSAIYQMVALLMSMGILFALMMRRMFIPLLDFVSQIKNVFSHARSGDFSQRVKYRLHDEIGEVASSTNNLMNSFGHNIGAIARDVEGLTGSALPDADVEPMEHMANVVNNLTRAVRFKEEIEADRDLDEVYQHIHRVLKRDFVLERFAMYEVSSQKNRSVSVFSEGVPAGVDDWCSSDVASDANACRAKRSLRIVDSRLDSGICQPFCGNCKQACGALRHICLPSLNSDGDGVILQIVFEEEKQPEIEKKVSLLEYYMRVAAPEIEAKRLMKSLKETSMRDALTGMYNRRFLDEFICSLESSVTRRDSTLGVLMCDIDHFKQVNDQRGHASGDRVLVEVSGILKDAVRASDLIVRYGGEEILVLLMDASAERTAEVAERIRYNIEKHDMTDDAGHFFITISIGMAMYPDNGTALDACIQNADQSLYEAKGSGRNRVVRLGDSTGQP